MWNNIVSWFGETFERNRLISDFNRNASQAWDSRRAPTLLRARITWGESNNKHNFSRTYSGFRIIAATGGYMNREKCGVIGMIIMSDQTLVRKLIRCGFDTLEVYGDSGNGFETGLQNLLIE
tara:strand:- start:387 stop:752 length:366 start_codon:yes stop_codon:yes gene_type:complete